MTQSVESKYLQIRNSAEFGWTNPIQDEDGITIVRILDNGYVVEIDIMEDCDIRCKTIDYCETYTEEQRDIGKNHKSVKTPKAAINYIKRMEEK